MTRKNGTFYYTMEENTVNHILTCSLDGLERDEYTVRWIRPEKPNGESRPEVSIVDNNLIFARAYPAQHGIYICNIGGVNASVHVSITEAPTNPGNYYTS